MSNGGNLDLSLLSDGTYVGEQGEFHFELRIDLHGLGTISGDVYKGSVSEGGYVVSFKTEKKAISTEPGVWQVALGRTVKQEDHAVFDGFIVFSTIDDGGDRITGLVKTGPSSEDVLEKEELPFDVRHNSIRFRKLAVELRQQSGIEVLPDSIVHGTRNVSLPSVFENAGFQTEFTRETFSEPANDISWDTSNLHDQFGNLPDLPQWHVQLLWLGSHKNAAVLGEMFDYKKKPQRQQAAVFEEGIAIEPVRDDTAADKDMLRIFSAAHEIGHALNLLHAFERTPNARHTFSIMNYPKKFIGDGGGTRNKFWEGFDFKFTEDELYELRHSFRYSVIPGGDDFKGSDGQLASFNRQGGGESGLSLRLKAPEAGCVLTYGQLFMVNVQLRNRTDDPVFLDKSLLDVKAGDLQIWIRRSPSMFNEDSMFKRFEAISARFYGSSPDTARKISRYHPLQDNANITFGAAGFTFAEPGNYEMFALLELPPQDHVGQDLGGVLESNVLRLRVGHPHSVEEERDALTLFDPDAGLFFMLGGARSLQKIGDELLDVAHRRMHGKTSVKDPVTTGILRAHAFHLARDNVGHRNGRLVVERGDSVAAGKLLSRLGRSNALKFLDPYSARRARSFVEKHKGTNTKRGRKRKKK